MLITAYNKYIQTNLTNMFFYTDSNDYPRTQAGLLARCYDEVVAEAKDTGDFCMYGEEMLRQSAQWKMEDILREVA